MAKYEILEKDGIRKKLLELANDKSFKSQKESCCFTHKITDVTGSLGCWGIKNDE